MTDSLPAEGTVDEEVCPCRIKDIEDIFVLWDVFCRGYPYSIISLQLRSMRIVN